MITIVLPAEPGLFFFCVCAPGWKEGLFVCSQEGVLILILTESLLTAAEAEELLRVPLN